MRRIRIALGLAGGMTAALALGLGSAAAGTQERSLNDGVYTPEQAERGKALYLRKCSNCHEPDEYRDYLEPWIGTPVSFFYEVVASSMPEDNPGGLDRQEYVDVLTFVFSINGAPAGEEELSGEPGALDEIVIAVPTEAER